MAEATTQKPPATGTFCWNELMTRDPDAARRFYTGLFGWTTEEMDMGPAGTYTIFKKGETHAGGLMEIKGPQAQGATPMWTPYVAVEDVDASTRKAESLGATVCVPPTDIPDVGRFSIVTDPTGGSIGLYRSAR